MSKRKPLDKAEARERRNGMLESAAAAELSLTEGVREMRAIAGMTQDEFARHRGVSARVIKALELGQGNPTVATLNRIGQFFGLEVAFVPIKRDRHPADQPLPVGALLTATSDDATIGGDMRKAIAAKNRLAAGMQKLNEMIAELDVILGAVPQQDKTSKELTKPALMPSPAKPRVRNSRAAGETPTRTKKKPRSD